MFVRVCVCVCEEWFERGERYCILIGRYIYNVCMFIDRERKKELKKDRKEEENKGIKGKMVRAKCCFKKT